MAAKKRVMVGVDEEQYEQVKRFSDKTGIPISRVVRDAIKSYMFVQAEAILERRAEIEREMTSKIVCINHREGTVEPLDKALAELLIKSETIVPPAS